MSSVVEPHKLIHVVTLSTDSGNATMNWVHGAKKLGYNFTLLGQGQKWGGWSWRTKQYIAAIEKLPTNTLVLVVDTNDVLLCRGPRSLYRAYKAAGNPLLMFGGEPTCCVGKFEATKMNGERHRAINTIDARLPMNRWKFPNAGCIMGARDTVLNALRRVQEEPDDQAGHLEHYLKDERYLEIDWQHRIVGNVNRPGMLFCVTTSMADDADSVEMGYWDKASVTNLATEATEQGEDPTVYNDSIGGVLYRNRVTGGIPCVLHFPGKNIYTYNLMGAMVYGVAFRPVQNEVPNSVGKSALIGIASLWKH